MTWAREQGHIVDWELSGRRRGGVRKSYNKTGEQHQPVDRIEVEATVVSSAHTKRRTHARLERFWQVSCELRGCSNHAGLGRKTESCSKVGSYGDGMEAVAPLGKGLVAAPLEQIVRACWRGIFEGPPVGSREASDCGNRSKKVEELLLRTYN